MKDLRSYTKHNEMNFWNYQKRACSVKLKLQKGEKGNPNKSKRSQNDICFKLLDWGALFYCFTSNERQTWEQIFPRSYFLLMMALWMSLYQYRGPLFSRMFYENKLLRNLKFVLVFSTNIALKHWRTWL